MKVKSQHKTVTSGEILRTLRNLIELDQVDLAEKIGVSEKTIGRWETEEKEPRLTAKQFYLLYDALNLDIKKFPLPFSNCDN